jgi:hypothetical protein
MASGGGDWRTQIGGSRASRNSKVTTQRDEGAGLAVLHGLDAGSRFAKAARG